jgi:hypothetical protein
MTVKKSVNGPKKSPSLEVKKLIKKLGIKGNIQITRRKTWFSDAMSELDKKDK